MGKLKALLNKLRSAYYSQRWGKFFRGFVGVLTFISIIFAILTGWKALHDAPTNIHGHYSRYVVGRAVSYSGEIVNYDDSNAEDFSFKGKFGSKISGIDVDTLDIVKTHDFDNKFGIAQFTLDRLSSGNHCQFDIIVNLENDKNGDMQISWRGGKGLIELQKADRNFERGIALGQKVKNLEVSHDARRRWIDSNTKVIGAAK
jgi:hypothetical protein